MRKFALMTVGVAVAAVSMVGLVQTQAAKAARTEPKVTICHRTGSYSNPYVKITVAQHSVDNNKGNDNGKGDHYAEHKGPIFYPAIPKHTEWGDIIPPVPGVHSGLNWTAQGQAIYRNGCNLVSPNLSYDVFCVLVSGTPMVRVSLSNSGSAAGDATVNGTVISVAAGQTEIRDFSNGTVINIVINGVTVHNNVENCPAGTPKPELAFDIVCDIASQSAVVTLSNSGNADGDATLNGTVVTVPVGAPVIKSLPTGTNGVQVTIVIDKKTVFDQLISCKEGVVHHHGGSGKSLPNTSGGLDQPVAVAVTGLAALIVLASAIVRRALVKQI